MGLFSSFGKPKYFDGNITPKCAYCQYVQRSKTNEKGILCEKGVMNITPDHSCGKFVYSPLKRIPVKQLNFVGSMADEELYLESAGDRTEKDSEQEEV